jgi:hypothetical protein
MADPESSQAGSVGVIDGGYDEESVAQDIPLNEPRIETLHIKLEDYDDLRLTVRQASKNVVSNVGYAVCFHGH